MPTADIWLFYVLFSHISINRVTDKSCHLHNR